MATTDMLRSTRRKEKNTLPSVDKSTSGREEVICHENAVHRNENESTLTTTVNDFIVNNSSEVGNVESDDSENITGYQSEDAKNSPRPLGLFERWFATYPVDLSKIERPAAYTDACRKLFYAMVEVEQRECMQYTEDYFGELQGRDPWFYLTDKDFATGHSPPLAKMNDNKKKPQSAKPPWLTPILQTTYRNHLC